MHAQSHVSSARLPNRSVAFSVELGPIAHAVGRELCGQVAPERIEQLLRDLLEQEFSEARVTTFLPIFLHRFACDTLRAENRGRHQDGGP